MTAELVLLRTPQPLEAVIIDVDGTLYRQAPVHRAMIWRLARTYRTSPLRAITTLRVLRAYRQAQEALRDSNHRESDLATAQIRLASQWTRTAESVVEGCVARWMERAPLDLVRQARRNGVIEFLEAAKQSGLHLAVFSDYPAEAKLTAMGVAEFFDVVLCAQDPEVQQFKPGPLGIHIALRRLGVEAGRALYVGDRPDTDVEAAKRAGVSCVILGRRAPRFNHRPWLTLPSFEELRDVIQPR
jgi:phosphoglycolate phosphatase/putative hydrolase of the HAD superfamily